MPFAIGDAPITALLSWAWVSYTIEADNAVEAAATEQVGRLFPISLAMWANGLRLIPEDGTTVAEWRRGSGAGCNLGGLERWGWIAVGEPGQRRKGFGTRSGIKADTVLRPTRAGSFARRIWPEVIEATDERWTVRFGSSALDHLSSVLAKVGASMPWAPPEVHPSNGFATVVVGPVEEEPNSFGTRLGQALTAITLGAEAESPVSLPLGANLLRVVADDRVPIRDLPARAGISKEAATMALNYAIRTRLADKDSARTVGLTKSGLAALEVHTAVSSAQEDRELKASLEPIVSARSALAEGLEPPPGGWRAKKPYLAQTQRLLADPIAALPWQPMVLHRGGWPDGS
jgi:hypothetical protein